MRITITGLTDVTIRLNTIGITIHGKDVARNIDIVNKNQEGEIKELIQHGLVSVESAEIIQKKESLLVQEKKEVIEEKPKRRGRPKGAKNKKPRKQASKEEDQEADIDEGISAAVAAAAVKMAEKTDQEIIDGFNKGEFENTKVVIGTDDGSLEVTARNKAAGDIPETEATKASIEAAKKLEAEETKEAEENEHPEINEEDLDISERMGSNAVIATGKDIITKPMTHSMLEDNEPNMIDPDPLEGVDVKEVEAEVETVDFIDNDDTASDPAKDPFIEI